jgi:hypothetical protein
MLAAAAQCGIKKLTCWNLDHDDDDLAEWPVPECMIVSAREIRIRKGDRVRGFLPAWDRMYDQGKADDLIPEIQGAGGESSLCIPVTNDFFLRIIPYGVKNLTLVVCNHTQALDALPWSIRRLEIFFGSPDREMYKTLRTFFRERVIPHFEAHLSLGSYWQQALELHEKSLVRVRTALAMARTRLKGDVVRLVAEKIPLNL